MTNQKVDGRTTVHKKYGNPDEECRGLRSILDRATLVDTDEPVTCTWCTGVRNPRTPKAPPVKAARGRPAGRGAHITGADVARQLVPTTVVQSPPLRYSDVLKAQAMDLLKVAILLEQEGR